MPNLLLKIARGVVLWSALTAAGCVASPLPLPPELDESRMELWSTGQEQVRFIGVNGALQPPSARLLLVENISTMPIAETRSVLFMTTAAGAFEVGLAGSLEDTYLFSYSAETRYEPILECTSVGMGGVRNIEDEPPPPDPNDEDGDGIPASEDCDDADASVGSAAPEVCDGLDNDCDGEIDEDCLCGSSSDCDDGLFCNGAETCDGGTCVAGVPENCDDGDVETFDACSEVIAGCTHE